MSKQLHQAPSVRGALQLRSTTTLASDLAAFPADGTNLKRAKLFNNVIREPLFAISVDKVCPPGLHITLGIFFRLFSLLEDACHELDVRSLLQGVNGGQSYEAYVLSYRRKVELDGKCRTLQSAISILDQFVTILTLNSALASTASQLVQLGHLQSAIERSYRIWKQRSSSLRVFWPRRLKKTRGLSFEPWTRTSSPFTSTGRPGTIVGNHVNSSLKAKNIDTMCASMQRNL